MTQRVSHERIRQLLAARIDGPLSRNEYRLVAAHLRTCVGCRQADRDYRTQRAQLRSLPVPIPPRDLWPRTSAALDREVARSRRRYGRRRPAAMLGRQVSRTRHSAALAGLLTAIATITALATFQLAAFQVAPNAGSAQSGKPALPTPFSIADQQIAFVGGTAGNVTVYRTRVNRMCPIDAPDCVPNEGITGTPVDLPNGAKPRNVALSPSGRQLAVVGENVGRDVFAVVLLPSEDGPATILPTGGLITPQLTTAATPPISAASNATPDTNTESGSATIPPNAVSPESSGGPPANTPPATAVAGLTVLAILDNVHSAGAPPAWSADGSMLAFSAMPADGSHGPDVYTWQPSQTRAQPITSDHESFFASWSGNHIVASRLLNDPSDATPQVATVVIDPQTLTERTVDGPQMWLPAVDSGSNTAVVWYGQLAWNGALPTPGAGSLYMADWSQLDPYAADNTVTPTVPPSMTALPSESPGAPEPSATPPQPSASAPEPSATPPETSPSAPPEPTPTPPAPASPPPSIGTPPTPSSPPGSGGLDIGPAVQSTGGPSPAATAPVIDVASGSPDVFSTPALDSAPPSISPSPTPALPAVLLPLDPNSTFSGPAVTDWQVSWSSDGQVLGIWIADVAGSSWGQLVVLAVDPQTGQLSTNPPLLAPTLARRGFTLGLSRVAFVASSNDTPDGELRVRTWGAAGSGDLVLHAPDGQEVVPAF